MSKEATVIQAASVRYSLRMEGQAALARTDNTRSLLRLAEGAVAPRLRLLFPARRAEPQVSSGRMDITYLKVEMAAQGVSAARADEEAQATIQAASSTTQTRGLLPEEVAAAVRSEAKGHSSPVLPARSPLRFWSE